LDKFAQRDIEHRANAIQATQGKITAAEIALDRGLADPEGTGQLAVGHAALSKRGAY
jgi:hypothetical protein